MAVSQQTGSGYGQTFPLENLTYDLITVLYQKSKGLEAYEQYLQDAQSDQEVSRLLRSIAEYA